MSQQIALDSSYLVQLLDPRQPQHNAAIDYLRYFLDEGRQLYCSTLALAELNARFNLSSLPLFKSFRLLPFNYDDARQAAFLHAEYCRLTGHNELPLTTDFMILAQVVTHQMDAFLLDERGMAPGLLPVLFNTKPPFRVLDLATPYEAAFGLTGKLF